MCAEGLSVLLRQANRRGLLHGSRVCRNAPSVRCPIFCLQMSVLFCRVDHQQCSTLKNILINYEQASGQAINFDKSRVGSNPRKGIKWTSWDDACVRKEFGGMGFQNFHFPYTLISWILKAKYYPRGDFLNDDLGLSPSFAWRSVWSSQDIVRRGIWWGIGEGNNIRIWDDPWLNDDHNFYLTTPRFIEGTRVWDLEVLTENFNEDDIERILKTLPSIVGSIDKRIWHFSANGILSPFCIQVSCDMPHCHWSAGKLVV
ncbi:hypothetical protein ACS0TY_025410 [Phlomoides rotata]